MSDSEEEDIQSLFNLEKLRNLKVRVEWVVVEGEKAVDLDCSCVFFDLYGRVSDAVYFNQLDIGYAKHLGDNRSLDGNMFNETIQLDLEKVDGHVGSCVIVINCHSGGSFENVTAAKVTMIDSDLKKECLKVDLACQGSHTAFIVCIIEKDENFYDGLWKIHQVNRTCEGLTFKDCEKEMVEELRKKSIIPCEETVKELMGRSSEDDEEDVKHAKDFSMTKGQLKTEKEMVSLFRKISRLQRKIKRMKKEIPNGRIQITTNCGANNLDKRDIIGSSDPYFIITGPDGETRYKSQIIMNDLFPRWKEDVTFFCENQEEFENPYTVTIFDWDKHTEDDLIGKFTYIPSEVEEGELVVKEFEVIHPEMKKKKKKYKNSGVFIFIHYRKKVLMMENPRYGKLEKEILELKKKFLHFKLIMDSMKN